ncbi:MAG: hypothetical protein AMXMBFR53_38380 [Gemmatimonadota bacterium]
MIDIDATFLPVGRMRLVSRVTRLDDATISGEVDLQDHWAFADHFPGDPIFPGSLIVEAAGQLVALWAWAQGQRGHPRLVKTSASFREPVVPDVGAIELRAEVRARRHLTFAEVSVWACDVRVASVGVTLAVLPRA